MFENHSGKEVVIDYDLLIGADGARSAVRNELEKFDKDFSVHAVQPTMSYIGLDKFQLPEDNRTLILYDCSGLTVFVSVQV